MACFAKLFHKNHGFNPTSSSNLPKIPDKLTKKETERYIAKPEGSIKFLNPDDPIIPENNHQSITLNNNYTTPSQNNITKNFNTNTNNNNIILNNNNNKQNTITCTSGTIINNNNSNNIIEKKHHLTTTHLNSNNNNNNNLHEKKQSKDMKIKKTDTNKVISTKTIISSTNTNTTNATTNNPYNNIKNPKEIDDKNEIIQKTFTNSIEQQQQHQSKSTNTTTIINNKNFTIINSIPNKENILLTSDTKDIVLINKSNTIQTNKCKKEKLLRNHSTITSVTNTNRDSEIHASTVTGTVSVNKKLNENKKDKQKTLRRPATTEQVQPIKSDGKTGSLNPLDKTEKSIEKLQKKIMIRSTEMASAADCCTNTTITNNNNMILENCPIENTISVVNLPILGAHIIGNKDYEERRRDRIQPQYGTKITVPLYLEELKMKQQEQNKQNQLIDVNGLRRVEDENQRNNLNTICYSNYKNVYNNVDYQMTSKNDRCNQDGSTLIKDFSCTSSESLVADGCTTTITVDIEKKDFNNLKVHSENIDCSGRLDDFSKNDEQNFNNSIDNEESLLDKNNDVAKLSNTRNKIVTNRDMKKEDREFTSATTDRKFSEVENKKSSQISDKDNRYLSSVSILQYENNAETGRKEGIFVIRPPVAMAENVPVHKKDEKTNKLIMRAIVNNDFLNNYMDYERIKRVIDAMEPAFYDKGKFIIRENEEGSEIYVSDDGIFDVIKNNEIINTLGSGIVFGELAILYNAKRFASIRAASKAKVWKIDRTKFRTIMKISGSKEREENLAFLKTAPLIRDLREDILLKIVDLLVRRFFPTNTCIIQQNDIGDDFYIIRGGTVTVKKTDDLGQEHKVNRLKRGDYFGEQALLNSDVRQASVYADAPGTECLKLDRVNFISYLGTIPELREIPIDRDVIPEINSIILNTPYDYIELRDLKRITSLGAGAFGRVDLVTYKDNKSFALKVIKKIDVVKQGQSDHIYNEKLVMSMCHRSPFIVELYKTFRDSKYVYFLMEACLGGDVWTIMYQMKNFDEKTARFISACVVEAFDFLHTRNIIFRDLKPENLMLTTEGYCKLVDFGFAKRLSPNYKTNTFAGTPEYVAPEIILDRGHDRAADYWALGVLIYELLIGRTPFRGKNQMKIYQNILGGINVIKMPSKIPKSAQNIIKHLCRQLPVERLGYQRKGIMDIKKHSWYDGFDWNRLQNQTMSSPIKRPINSIIDTQYFPAKFEIDSDIPPDEFSGWDINF